MSSRNEITDITIIGGGPTGMFAAFYAGMRNVKAKIIESLPVLGGQVGILYPDKKIYDIGGLPGVSGKELVSNLEEQMNFFDTAVHLEEKVLNIHKRKDGIFEIQTNKEKHLSKTILITTGQGSFKPRKLPIEDAELYEEDNMHYLVNNLDQYTNKTVVICGGGDSAVDWALTLEEIAKHVYLIHRRDKFRAHEASVELLKNSQVEVLTPFTPKKLHGKNGRLKAVTFSKKRSEETKTINLDHFIVSYGFVSSMDEVKEWGIELTKNGILVNPKMETSVSGIYAAGDIADFDGKLKLIATGFGEAPTAVNHAVHHIYPDQYTQPVQSTQLNLDSDTE